MGGRRRGEISIFDTGGSHREEDCGLISKNLKGLFAKLFKGWYARRRCADVNHNHSLASSRQLSLPRASLKLAIEATDPEQRELKYTKE
jgi:hypothetical protein